ncbi:MAG: CRTAC1 family protein [Planctomycetota bacterium]
MHPNTLLITLAVATLAGTAMAQVRFSDVTTDCGLDFVHAQGDAPVPPLFEGQNERFGVGAAVGDYDNDGFMDVYLPNSSGTANQLYRNNGDGTFTDVTDAAGVGHMGFSKQALWLDLNNDGFDDLVVLNDSSAATADFPRSQIFRNDGDGTFTNVTAASGFAPTDATLGGATAGDYDRDGDLDLLVVGWYEYTQYLYRNDGNFRFTDVTAEVGGFPADDRFHWQPVMLDMNGDGWVDIFAAVDFFPDYSLRNNGDGTFTDVSTEWNTVHVANDMGVAVADVDGDLDLDIYTTNMSFSPSNTNDEPGPNMLYVNDGSGVMTPGAIPAGIDNTFFAWGTWFFDADLDGDKDLAAVNGWQQPEWHTRAQFFLNRGDGRFDDAGLGSGLDHRGNSRGLTPIDLENDGDIDFIITDVYGPATVYRNETERNGNAWVRIEAQGTVSNRNGVGSKVYVTAGGRTQFIEIMAGGSFYSAPPLSAHFGLGRVDVIDRIRVVFPSGREATLTGVEANRVVTVTEP